MGVAPGPPKMYTCVSPSAAHRAGVDARVVVSTVVVERIVVCLLVHVHVPGTGPHMAVLADGWCARSCRHDRCLREKGDPWSTPMSVRYVPWSRARMPV